MSIWDLYQEIIFMKIIVYAEKCTQICAIDVLLQ